MSRSVDIPYHFSPRKYQREFLSRVEDAIDGKSKVRYFFQVWHRRAGKDKTNIAANVPKRLIINPCLVKFVFPTLKMGRENLWQGIGGDGFRYINHIPEEIRASKANESRMEISVLNGTETPSLFSVGGSDNPDSLRGGNPKMFIFSEWADQDPYAWDVVEPILRENGGIAIFNTTPKGDNHARAMLEYAKNNPLWHIELLTAEDTGIWSLQQLDEIRNDIIKRFEANGRSEGEAISYFEQEYMCSFKAPVIGSYYGKAIMRAEKENRITNVPWIEALPVHTFWDLGMDDSMSIWFMQVLGQEFHFIDYYENSGEGLAHYARVLQQKNYLYGRQYAPHDIAVRELGTGKSRLEVASSLGIRFEAVPNIGLLDGIDATRSIIGRCWFDKNKCSRGINCLKNYRKDWDEKNKVFKNNPKHDWASHGSDSFRMFGVGYKKYVAPVQQTSFGGVKPYIPGIG